MESQWNPVFNSKTFFSHQNYDAKKKMIHFLLPTHRDTIRKEICAQQRRSEMRLGIQEIFHFQTTTSMLKKIVLFGEGGVSRLFRPPPPSPTFPGNVSCLHPLIGKCQCSTEFRSQPHHFCLNPFPGSSAKQNFQ